MSDVMSCTLSCGATSICILLSLSVFPRLKHILSSGGPGMSKEPAVQFLAVIHNRHQRSIVANNWEKLKAEGLQSVHQGEGREGGARTNDNDNVLSCGRHGYE